ILAVTIRQTEVKQYDVRCFGSDALDSFSNRTRARHLIVICLKRRLEEAQDCRFVVDNQHADFCAHACSPPCGKVMTKRAPRPFSIGLSPLIVPPWASMMPFAMASPSPVP